MVFSEIWFGSGRKSVARRSQGFTLLELLIVVGVLATLVALALPFYQDYLTQSRQAAAEADLQTFQKALAMYDQLEPTMYNSSNFLGLIGKYMQDFRKSDGQISPVDPWGREYIIIPQSGAIVSYGPDGIAGASYDHNVRLAGGDDILVTWKPPFFVSAARAISARAVEVTFSRKIATVSASLSLVPAVIATGSPRRISDTVYRFGLATDMNRGTTYTLTLPTATSQDGKVGFHANPETPGDPNSGQRATFTY